MDRTRESFVAAGLAMAREIKDLKAQLAEMTKERDAAREACVAIKAWMDREKAGYDGPRGTPDEERQFYKWFDENTRLCDAALKQLDAALAQSTNTEKEGGKHE